MVCCVFRMTMQRYNIFRHVPNFRLRFGAILMKNSSNLLTLGRAHASIALLSLNRNFEHELTAFCRRACSRSAESMRASLCSRLIAAFARFLRAVIHDARCRNFHVREITLSCQRSRWGYHTRNISPLCHIATLPQ